MYGYIDSACTSGVAGKKWLIALRDALEPFGLAPIVTETHEVFHGVSGAIRVAKRRWTFPAGIRGRHTGLGPP